LEVRVLARVTIEDCLKNVDNRFTLVHLAAKRIRQVREGADLLVKSSKNEDVVSVLREIAANRVFAKKEQGK
jgi:DNA-directed RNA polymerase subunit omega